MSRNKRFIDKSGKEKIHLEYNMHRINFSKAANLKKRIIQAATGRIMRCGLLLQRIIK